MNTSPNDFSSPDDFKSGVEVEEGAKVPIKNLENAIQATSRVLELSEQALQAGGDMIVFTKKKLDAEKSLREALTAAISVINFHIDQEKSFNQNPTADVAQLTEKAEKYKAMLFALPQPVEKIENQFDGDQLDSTLNREQLDSATRNERSGSQAAGGAGLNEQLL